MGKTQVAPENKPRRALEPLPQSSAAAAKDEAPAPPANPSTGVRLVRFQGRPETFEDTKFEQLAPSGEWELVQVPLKNKVVVSETEATIRPAAATPQPMWDFSALAPLRLRPLRMTAESVDWLGAEVRDGADPFKILALWGRVEWEHSEAVCELIMDSAGVISGVSPNSKGRKDLSHLWLRGLSFRGCDLGGMVFDNSSLRHADLSGCNLKLASLRNCQLSGASFVGSILEEADLSNTICLETVFLPEGLDPMKFVKNTRLQNAAFVGRAFFLPMARNLFGAPDLPSEVQQDDGYGAAPPWRLAGKVPELTLQTHLDELRFLLTELDRLREYQVTPSNWQEFVDAWAALEGLYDSFTCKRALMTIEELFSLGKDAKMTRDGPRGALGMALALYPIRGEPPAGLLLALKQKVARKLRSPYYFTVVMRLRDEINVIQLILQAKQQFRQAAQNGLLSLMIGITNFVGPYLADKLSDLTG